MLVFARDTTPLVAGNDARRRPPQYNRTEGANTVELKELTQLNRHLLENSDAYETAEQVIATWRLLGVVKTEAAPTGGVQYGQAAVERILNLVVSHRVSLLNYWLGTSSIVPTQKLYIVVKRDKANKGAWQLFPWTDGSSGYPRPADLTTEQFGQHEESVGAYYYVGRSSDQVYAHFGHSERRAAAKPKLTESLLAQGMMSSLEISLGV